MLLKMKDLVEWYDSNIHKHRAPPEKQPLMKMVKKKLIKRYEQQWEITEATKVRQQNYLKGSFPNKAWENIKQQKKKDRL